MQALDLLRELRGLKSAVVQFSGPVDPLDAIELAKAEASQRTESARDLRPSTEVAALVVASGASQDEQRRRRRTFVAGAFAALAVFAVVVAVLAVMARQLSRPYLELVK